MGTRSAAATVTPGSVSPGVVEAAGGIITQKGATGRTEIAIVHRPLRSDWTFPKGKREEAESFEECALREVKEETGFDCRLRWFLGHTEYRDRKDRPKVVAYWVMEVTGGEFKENHEVNALLWVDLETAAVVLTYDRDRDLLSVLESGIEDVPLT